MDSTLFNTSLLHSLNRVTKTDPEEIPRPEVLFSEVCRTCFCKTVDNSLEDNLLLTNQSSETSITIKEAIEACAGIKIDIHEKLPLHLCNNCLQIIETCFAFRLRCQHIDLTLRTFLTQIQASKVNISTESHPALTVGSAIKSEKVDEGADGAVEQHAAYEITVMDEGTQSQGLPCQFCDMKFQNPTDMEKHIAEHTSVPGKKVFKCKICPREYTYRNGLHNHMKTAHAQGKCPVQCPGCRKQFKRECSLKRHISRFCVAPYRKQNKMKLSRVVLIEGEGPEGEPLVEVTDFSCSLCEGTFELESDFLKHMVIHESPQRCPYCGQRFKRAGILESHIRCHNGDKSFMCPLCSLDFYSTRKLRNHLKDHHKQQKPQTCNQCKQSFSSKRDLMRHLRKNPVCKVSMLCWKESKIDDLQGNVKPSKSGECAVKQEPAIDLDSNVVDNISIPISEIKTEPITDWRNENPLVGNPGGTSETSVNEPIVANIAAENTGAGLENKEEVFERPHVQLENIIYDASGYQVTNEPLSDDEPSLDEAEEDRTQAPSIHATFNCLVSDCKLEFKFYQDVLNHCSNLHCDGPPFKCPQCSQEFSSKFRVRKHIKMHIKGEYKCSDCPRIYQTLSEMKTHIRTHTGERPFKCNLCIKRFKQRSALKAHLSTHKDKKEFRCEICSKEFFSYNGLFLHTKSHTQNEKLQCKSCQKQFPTPSRLRRHEKTLCCRRKQNDSIAD